MLDLISLEDPEEYPAYTVFTDKCGVYPSTYLWNFEDKETGRVIADRIESKYKDFLVSRKVYSREEKGVIKELSDIKHFFNSAASILIECHRDSVKVYYDNDRKTSVKKLEDIRAYIEEQVEIARKRQSKGAVSLLRVSDYGHLSLRDTAMSVPEVDLDLNYGSDFPEIHKSIVEKLSSPKGGGLFLFHGPPGTGKTTYLKYLSSVVKRQFVYIPSNMTEYLGRPEFGRILDENKRLVFIIEDSEKIVQSREETDANYVSTVLNLTDGILGSISECSIILTFNSDREQIDKALLRKGRLRHEHSFEELTIEDSQKVLDHLGLKYRAKKPMTLAEIYNVEEETGSKESKEKGSMGFAV